ncbi:HAD-IIIC family phosphatase [Actinoallomurus vinaceus]|uniref:HAD-IIIC family phosphatase n=1 Tax=Actinoallomurus vinaceus TaxID=1080074 RepID=A0ABP8U723_9ACTN
MSDNTLDELRTAVAERRLPAPAVRRALAGSAEAALMRKAGRLLAGLEAENAPAVSVAVHATFTAGSFEPLLRAALVGAGLAPAIEHGEYGTFDLTLATAALTADVVTLLLDAAYFLPRDWSADLETLEKHVEARLAEFRGLLAGARERTSALLVLHTVPLTSEVRDAFISVRARAGVARLWCELNASLLRLVEEDPQVVTVDLVGALAEAPVPVRDARLHRYGDMPYTDGALLVLAGQVRRVVQAKRGLSRKVLALDLDNTLWGGVVGEVGAQGVQLGGLYPGNCYLELQRTARRLRDQGVILVLASKNDPQVVEEALTGHPEVLLRPDAFSVSAVNWSAKAGNLRDAARSLGLSTDAFVFMDDSDFERGHVAGELPEVALVPANGDPAYLVGALLRDGWFDVMALTETDRRRPELYRTRALRSDFATGFGSSEEYLAELGIGVEIAPATGFTVARLAQLAARTNQFNLTGIRFDEAETAAMSADPGHLVASIAVADRFGDDGIVGAVWVDRRAGAWKVLNLVLSCRVLGRGVELAIAGWLLRTARDGGAGTVEGRFTRSPKNGVAADFWTRAGFTQAGDGEVFAFDLSDAFPDLPEWITLRERSDD